MRRPVFWSAEALRELHKAIVYIADHNPAAARRVFVDIRKTASDLGEMAIGRRGRVTGTYEKLVQRRPYIIVYALDPLRVGGERVVILRVIHDARHWPDDQWPE